MSTQAYNHILSLENAALTAMQQRHWHEAVAAHAEAIPLAEGLGDHRLTATLLLRLGHTLFAQGEVQDAVAAYETGVAVLANDPGYDVQEVLWRLTAAVKGYGGGELVYVDLPQWPGDDDLQRATEDPSLVLQLLLAIGHAYLSQPQPGPALNAYITARARPEIDEFPLLQAHLLTGLAAAYLQEGSLPEAEEAGEAAVSLYHAQGDTLQIRSALSILGAIARRQDRVATAEQHLTQARNLYEQAQDRIGLGRVLVALAELYLGQNRWHEAQPLFDQARLLGEETEDAITRWLGEWGMGRCLAAAGDLYGAAWFLHRSLTLSNVHYRELRTDQGRVSFSESIRQIREALLDTYLDLTANDPLYFSRALEIVEDHRGAVLLELMQGRQRRYGKMPEPPDFAMEDPSFSPAQMALGVGIDPEMAASLGLPQGESLTTDPGPESSMSPLTRLVYQVLDQRSVVFVVTPQGEIHGHIIPQGEKDIDQLVSSVRTSLGTLHPRGMQVRGVGTLAEFEAAEESSLASLQEGYDWLIAPVAPFLPIDTGPLVIEPDRSLWLMPFVALQDPSGQWFGDQYPLITAPSAAILHEIRNEAPYGDGGDLQALIVGDPDMPDVPTRDGLEIKLDPLPGARLESQAIADLFQNECRTLLVGDEARKDEVLDQMGNHGILHLATHGVAYEDDPLASFVALAPGADGDGLLTARQVMDMRLPVELAVLSACQTGLGKVAGEGMIGLSRAFLVTGVRSVLVSQWNVDDAATAILMGHFYRFYLSQDNKAVALQKAIQATRSDPVYGHPRQWASFLLIGAE